jgi:Fe-S cluster assembly iron-binding protein IscA
MPTITQRASERLAEARKRRGLPASYAARLSRRDGKLVLDFTPTPPADDPVAAEGEMRLFVDPAVAADLEAVSVDVQERGGRERLVLRRAHARR